MLISRRNGTVLLGALLASACGNGMSRDVPPPPSGGEDSAVGGTGVRDTIPHVRVIELLERRDWNGLLVRVRGRCLGYRVPPVATGGPPRTRSDWQLEAEGVAIYVTGPLPEGCSATQGGNTELSLVARVAEDSLPALGGQPSRARRYLEWGGGPLLPARP